MNNKFIWGAIAVVFIVAVIALFTGNKVVNVPVLSGTTNYDTISATGLQIGTGCADGFGSCKGTTITQILKGTCTLLGTAVAQSASTTVPYDCAVTNAVSGDTVLMQFATSTRGSETQTQWVIIGAKASTTAGYVTAEIRNLGADTATLGATGQLASTTSYLIFR
jgi:hypothetical protein